MNNLLLRYHH